MELARSHRVNLSLNKIKYPLNMPNYSGLCYAADLSWETSLKYEDGFYHIKPQFNFETEHGSFINIYKQIISNPKR